VDFTIITRGFDFSVHTAASAKQAGEVESAPGGFEDARVAQQLEETIGVLQATLFKMRR
jgi:hypothetical protein